MLTGKYFKELTGFTIIPLVENKAWMQRDSHFYSSPSPALLLVSEFFHSPGITCPVFSDLYPGLEIKFATEHGFHIFSGFFSCGLKHKPALADDDPFLTFSFHPDHGVHIYDFRLPFESLNGNSYPVWQFLPQLTDQLLPDKLRREK